MFLKISISKIAISNSGVRPLGPSSNRKFMTNVVDTCVNDSDYRSNFYRSPSFALKKDRNHLNRNINGGVAIKEIPYIERTRAASDSSSNSHLLPRIP